MVDRLLAEAEALPPIAAPTPVAPQAGAARRGSLGAGGAAAGGCPRAASRSGAPAEADASRSRPHEAGDRPPRAEGRSRSARAAAVAGRRRAGCRPIHRSCSGRRGFAISPPNAMHCRAGSPQRKLRRPSFANRWRPTRPRIAAIPARETELVELTRDYETLRQIYTGLLTKNENARASANLERRQIGEQFRLLEPARLPERPISPNRPQIYTMGALGGLALGLGLALLARLSRPDAANRGRPYGRLRAAGAGARADDGGRRRPRRDDAGSCEVAVAAGLFAVSAQPRRRLEARPRRRCDTDMYEKFFGLRERPFDLTPNPRFMYFTPRHREALVSLEFGIESRKGVVVLIGEAGMGKTTVIRAAIDEAARQRGSVRLLEQPAPHARRVPRVPRQRAAVEHRRRAVEDQAGR